MGWQRAAGPFLLFVRKKTEKELVFRVKTCYNTNSVNILIQSI